MDIKTSRIIFTLAFVALAIYVVMTVMELHHYAGWLLVSFFILVAIGLRGFPLLKGYSYPMVIFAAVSSAMYYPQYFLTLGGVDLKVLITPLLQIIMFGMGTTLSLWDFARVIKMPKGVIVGIICQFTIMPFVGWSVAQLFSFPKEIAAGIILIGSCPSGLASNVMSYLAKANLALSITLTAVATIMAPVMTPFYMKVLGGEFIDISYLKMMWDITKVVIIPIGAGLLFHHLLQSRFKILDTIMPMVSMAGIALILVIIIARGRDELIEVGLLLVVAVFIHNMLGYLLGYSASKMLRMPEQDCRTIALEVGMQNGGLATSIATDTLGKAGTVGLAPAIFGSLMNITGSTLALWWRGRKIPGEEN
ncbi:MAG TPA: bile acid:sodium symporter family protein [Cyclobacteriaceae bacterium]|nr:bile acid:sodium symporter family protein [Cyclobacteriaceae bacterium]